jgi:hypothetical protein
MPPGRYAGQQRWRLGRRCAPELHGLRQGRQPGRQPRRLPPAQTEWRSGTGRDIRQHHAVGPSASATGVLKAFPAGTNANNALALVNYTQDGNIANAATITLCRGGACPGGAQLSLLSLNADVRALIDVLGYFYPKNTNVLTVATDGGDFVSPAAAIAYLKALNPPPSASKPWLIRIDPGVYDLGAKPLELDVPHASVQGAGPAATILTGKGLKVTAGATAVRDLSITAVGAGGTFGAVQAGFTGGSLTLSNLEVDASGATNNTAPGVNPSLTR